VEVWKDKSAISFTANSSFHLPFSHSFRSSFDTRTLEDQISVDTPSLDPSSWPELPLFIQVSSFPRRRGVESFPVVSLTDLSVNSR